MSHHAPAVPPGVGLGLPYGRTVVSLPLWAIFTIGFGSPILAFAGVLLAQLMNRRGARELERRSKREETIRSLRWAAELAVSLDDRMADLGVAQLAALLTSDLLDAAEKVFVEAALDAVYQDPQAELDALGQDAEVIQLVDTDAVRLTHQGEGDVPLTTQSDQDGGDSDG